MRIKSQNVRQQQSGAMSMSRGTAQKRKDALLYGAIACGAYAVITLNKHMKECSEASKNTKRALWVVLSAVVGELVVKAVSFIHFGG